MGVVVLKNWFLIVSTLGEGVLVLKTLILTVDALSGCGGLENKLIFNSFYFGGGSGGPERIDF